MKFVIFSEALVINSNNIVYVFKNVIDKSIDVKTDDGHISHVRYADEDLDKAYNNILNQLPK